MSVLRNLRLSLKHFRLALILMPCLFSLVARAQETGQITGTVTDPSGAAIAGASVQAVNVATGAVRTTTSSGSGLFALPALAPSTYTVTVQAAGFNPLPQQIEVSVGAQIAFNPHLALAGNVDRVDVAAVGTVSVNTQTPELSQLVTPLQVSQLPSLTRNPYDFVVLSGNVSAGDNTSAGLTQNNTESPNRGVNYALNGQRQTGTEILLDGVENIAIFNDTIGINVPLDSVAEYRIQTSNFDARYGRASGGVVNVATKSGSNQLHGGLFEFNRLSAYTANTYTNTLLGLPRGKYTRNQFGGFLGGRVPFVGGTGPNKLFFFGSGELVRVRSGAVLTAAIPTPQFLAAASPNTAAFFSAYSGTNNFNVISTTTNAQVGAAVTPVSPAFYTALAPSTPVFETVSFTAPQNAGGGFPQNTFNVVGRLDYTLGEHTQSFFRYANYNEVDQAGTQFVSPYAQYDVGQSLRAQAFLLSVAHEFTPSLTSISKASFLRSNNSYSYNTALANVPILIVSNGAQLPGTSTPFQFPGTYDTNPGNGGLPFGGPQNTVQFNQDLSLTHGRHTYEAGAQIIYLQENVAFGSFAQAKETLGSNQTAGLQNLYTGNLFTFQAAVNPQGALPCVRNAYTGALIQTAACSVNLPASSPSFARSYRFHDWAVYLQDTFKATPRLTLSYGFRYEYYGVQHNNNSALDSNFYFGPGSSLPAQVRSGQVLTVPNSPVGSLWKPQYGTAAPRLGFAYDVFGDGSTALRGGFGISYERNFGKDPYNVIQNPPASAAIALTATAANPIFITNSNFGPLGGSTGSVPLPPTSLRAVDPGIRTASTQFYSLALDRRIVSGTVASIQYSGARGLHLYDIKNYNGPGSGNFFLGDPTQDPNPTALSKPALTRLNQQYGNINSRGSNGDSYFQSANIQLQSTDIRHSGLTLVANYTWSHETDTTSSAFTEDSQAGNFVLGYTNPFNPRMDYGNGDFDIRHRVVIAPIYRTPWFARDGSHGGSSHGALTQLLGGYEITAIFTARSGVPFTFFDTTHGTSGIASPRYTPAAGIVPQHSFKAIPSGASGINGHNLYVLGTLPAAASISNAALLGSSDFGPYPATMTARNSFRGPGAYNLDASVSKTFPIHERLNAEFRAEYFDLTNHHNLYIQEGQLDVHNSLNITASKGGIGTNGGANDERRFGQFAVKLNF